MLSKSMNLKEIALTACTAWLPQWRSSASREPGPYKNKVSLSSSAKWHILRGEGTASLGLNKAYNILLLCQYRKTLFEYHICQWYFLDQHCLTFLRHKLAYSDPCGISWYTWITRKRCNVAYLLKKDRVDRNFDLPLLNQLCLMLFPAPGL